MKRPKRTIRRESVATHRGRPLVLMREKGRRTTFELDILSAYSVAAKLAAQKRLHTRGARGLINKADR